MASGSTGYPAANDVFTVPSDPEDTPLSEAGDGTRDLTQSVGDQGAAIMALQGLAAVKTHNHAGGADGTHILSQSSTHANADTDSSPTAIHHTIGTGAGQVAAGNHTHPAPTLPQFPYIICTSATRPSSPFLGMLIFEDDTNLMKVWSTVAGITSWHITPTSVPICRLTASVNQALNQGGTIINWDTVLEDNNGFTSPGNITDVHFADPGLYTITAAIQWNTNQIPDSCWMVVTVNGFETHIRDQKFQRGETFTPGFSQTIHLSGKYRFKQGDVLRVKVDYMASTGIVGSIVTFFEHLLGQASYSNIASRMEVVYLCP